MSTMKSRKVFLDLLRNLACFLVIVNHTNSTIFLGHAPDSPIWYVSLTYFFISKIAVPIFFMISGYLLLSKVDSWKKALFRVLRIVIVLVVCGFIYSVYEALHLYPGTPLWTQIQNTAFKVHSKTPSNALWYLYAYLGVLLMLPFLQKMAQAMKKQDYHIFFVISGLFVSVLPILTHYFPDFYLFVDFQLPLFSGYICMLFVGNYFARFEIKKTTWGFLAAAALFVLMLAFNVVATYFEYQQSSTAYLFFDNRVFLPILVQSACVFYMVSFVRLPEKVANVVCYIGSCTFGIYLISDIVIGLLETYYEQVSSVLHVFVAMILYEICVFLIGLVITAVLKFIPYVKKVL